MSCNALFHPSEFPTEEEFQERWRVAQEEAALIQSYLARGYLVLADGERVKSMSIEKSGVHSRDKNYCLTWFSTDRTCDDGMYTPVDEIRRRFRNVEVFTPVKLIEQVQASLPHVNGRTPEANKAAVKKISEILQ